MRLYSTEHKDIEKNNHNRTATVLKCFYIFKKIVHSLDPGETPSYIVWILVRRRVTRRLTRLQTMYNVLKYCKKWLNNDNNQFTVTGVQPHRNRK